MCWQLYATCTGSGCACLPGFSGDGVSLSVPGATGCSAASVDVTSLLGKPAQTEAKLELDMYVTKIEACQGKAWLEANKAQLVEDYIEDAAEDFLGLLKATDISATHQPYYSAQLWESSPEGVQVLGLSLNINGESCSGAKLRSRFSVSNPTDSTKAIWEELKLPLAFAKLPRNSFENYQVKYGYLFYYLFPNGAAGDDLEEFNYFFALFDLDKDQALNWQEFQVFPRSILSFLGPCPSLFISLSWCVLYSHHVLSADDGSVRGRARLERGFTS